MKLRIFSTWNKTRKIKVNHLGEVYISQLSVHFSVFDDSCHFRSQRLLKKAPTPPFLREINFVKFCRISAMTLGLGANLMARSASSNSLSNMPYEVGFWKMAEFWTGIDFLLFHFSP